MQHQSATTKLEAPEETEAEICEREEQRLRDDEDAMGRRVPRGWYSPE